MKKSLQHRQTQLSGKTGSLSLSVLAGLVSPYFTDRDINLINQKPMTVKFVLEEIIGNVASVVTPYGSFLDIDTDTSLSNYFWNFDYRTYNDKASIVAAIKAQIVAQAIILGYSTFTASDIVYITDIESVAPVARVASSETRSIVTGTGATGFQVSATRDAQVNYNTTIVTAATLLNGAVGSVVLEIAPTNSATAGDWVEIGRLTNGQVFSLAVAIGCTQTISGQVGGYIPAGYYAKLRSINTTGTPTYSYNSGQKVLL